MTKQTWPTPETFEAFTRLARWHVSNAANTARGNAHGFGLPDEELAQLLAHLKAADQILSAASWELKNRRAADEVVQNLHYREICGAHQVAGASSDPGYLAFRIQTLCGGLDGDGNDRR